MRCALVVAVAATLSLLARVAAPFVLLPGGPDAHAQVWRVSARRNETATARCGLVAAAALVSALVLGVVPAAHANIDTCPNAQFRGGPSVDLPDCRAYELVSPSDTNGVSLTVDSLAPGGGAPFSLIAPSGDSVMFQTGGGSLPGYDGGGILDLYRAVRTDTGWQASLRGPTAALATAGETAGVSADHSISVFEVPAFDPGSLGSDTQWLRESDGGLDRLAPPDPATESGIQVLAISPHGEHVIFRGRQQGFDHGAGKIYDRTPGGALKDVSLLPGDAPLPGLATFQGSSQDGSTVLFASDGDPNNLYARVGDARTVSVANGFEVGGTLTCDSSTAPGATTDVQWLRDGESIPGATSGTYKAGPADHGTLIQCLVTATDGASAAIGTSQTIASVAPASSSPVATAFASISGPNPADSGSTLSCDGGSSVGTPTLSYQWFANGVAISGATSSTYTVQAADVPSGIQCAVYATNAAGTFTAVASPVLTNPGPSPDPPFVNVTLADPSTTSAGASADGGRAFYVQSGNIWGLDIPTQVRHLVSDTGDAQVVSVSADGSHVYFASRQQLDGGNGTAGQFNLYVWDGSAVRFIATVADADVDGNLFGFPRGLGLWTKYDVRNFNQYSGPGWVPAQSTPDGAFLVFEATAQLTDYDNQGHAEVYRYDAATGELACASCMPDGGAPAHDASLRPAGDDAVLPAFVQVRNITDDGQAVFFTDADSLVAADTDGVVDVYEWHAGHDGTPATVALISSGRSARHELSPFLGGGAAATNYFWGVSPDGHDVLLLSSDGLVAGKAPGDPALYDARVNGGFPSLGDRVAQCEGDACQGGTHPAPPADGPGTATYHGKPVMSAACRRLGEMVPQAQQRARKAQATAKGLTARARRLSRHPHSAKARKKASAVARRARRATKTAKARAKTATRYKREYATCVAAVQGEAK